MRKSISNLVKVIGVLTWSCLVGISCAPNKSDTDKNEEYPFPVYNTSSPLYQELKAALLTCEDTKCESNKSDFEAIGVVGMLAKGKPTDYEFRLGQCTGFLYGSQDIVALNSHCITDSMWENRDNCEEYLGIKFPAVPGHDEEIRMCDKILYRSDISKETALNIQADYAFFRIKKINRKALMLSQDPVRDQDAISFRKVNPLKNTLGGYLDYSFCVAQMGSLLNTNYKNEWSDTGLGVSYGSKDYSKKCEIRQGNSGSPVLNVRNEVVGLAQSYSTENFLKVFKSDLFSEQAKKIYKIEMVMDLPERLPEHFQFTQRVCIRDPKQVTVENNLCDENRKRLPQMADETLTDFQNTKSIEEYMRSISQGIYNIFPKFFKVIMQKKSDFYSYDIKPECLYNENQWDKSHLSISQSGFFGNAKTITVDQKPLFIDLKVTLKLDENFVYRSKTLSHQITYGDFITDINGKTIKMTKSYSAGKFFSYRKEESLPDVDWCH